MPPLILNQSRFFLVLLMSCVLCCCADTKLTRQQPRITVKQADGSTRSGKMTYYESARRSGLSQKAAVILDCYYAISGDRAEKDVIARRFPGAKHVRLDDARSGKKVYHCFKIAPPSREAFVFWIDATDYHGVS